MLSDLLNIAQLVSDCIEIQAKFGLDLMPMSLASQGAAREFCLDYISVSSLVFLFFFFSFLFLKLTKLSSFHNTVYDSLIQMISLICHYLWIYLLNTT